MDVLRKYCHTHISIFFLKRWRLQISTDWQHCVLIEINMKQEEREDQQSDRRGLIIDPEQVLICQQQPETTTQQQVTWQLIDSQQQCLRFFNLSTNKW